MRTPSPSNDQTRGGRGAASVGDGLRARDRLSRGTHPPPRIRTLLGAFGLLTLVASLTLLPAPAPTEAQTTDAGITIRMAASSAPNSVGSTTAKNSNGRWRDNAVHALRNGLTSRGDRQNDPTGYYQALDLYVEAQDLMVTSGKSWRGEAIPAAPYNDQNGNRVHFGFHAYGDGTVQFRLRDISPQVLSAGDLVDRVGAPGKYTLNAQIVLSTRTLNCLHRHGWNWGADRTKGTADDVKICTSTHANTADEWLDELVYSGYGNAYWPDQNLSNADRADKQKLQQAINQQIDAIDRDLKWFSGKVSIVGNNGVTYRGSKTLLYHRLRQSPEADWPQYGWCFTRMSERDCANNIARWEGEAEEINLPDSDHCPATHQIRTATTTGIKCEQTFHPVNPHWDTAGPTEPMRHDNDGNWADGSRAYTGDPRGCNTNGHPYYVLPRDRWHGPNRGCHKHDSGTTHEHGVGKHGSGPAGLNQLTRP